MEVTLAIRRLDGVNPATRDKFKVSAADVAKFTAGTAFEAALNPNSAARMAAKASSNETAARSVKMVRKT